MFQTTFLNFVDIHQLSPRRNRKARIVEYKNNNNNNNVFLTFNNEKKMLENILCEEHLLCYDVKRTQEKSSRRRSLLNHELSTIENNNAET